VAKIATLMLRKQAINKSMLMMACEAANVQTIHDVNTLCDQNCNLNAKKASDHQIYAYDGM
jgi:hypothetical protein